MENIYREEEFYKDNGWPTESLNYCSYIFYTGEKTEYGHDYDQFALVDNALYPYVRLTRKRGAHHFPCGGSSLIDSDGTYAAKSDVERDGECPKIAWGFAAVFLFNLRYDMEQKDYVFLKDMNRLIMEYYGKYLQIYLQDHNGLKFSKISDKQKELDFLVEHKRKIRELWEKSTPLKRYPELFEYADDAEKDYESFLQSREDKIRNKVDDNDDDEKKPSEFKMTTQNGEKSVYIENNNGSVTIK